MTSLMPYLKFVAYIDVEKMKLTQKRVFDIFVSSIGLLILLPAMFLIASIIKMSGPGPIFYKQTRVGYHGKLFTIFKFRTMVSDAEKLGPALTVGNDKRITKIGSWLRRAKLDELPQLLNVLRGEMSMVGPRPEVPHYVALYTPEQIRVLDIIPGITDPASIVYRNESEVLQCAEIPEQFYVQTVMADKISRNLTYSSSANVVRDFTVILGTLIRIFSK